MTSRRRHRRRRCWPAPLRLPAVDCCYAGPAIRGVGRTLGVRPA